MASLQNMQYPLVHTKNAPMRAEYCPRTNVNSVQVIDSSMQNLPHKICEKEMVLTFSQKESKIFILFGVGEKEMVTISLEEVRNILLTSIL